MLLTHHLRSGGGRSVCAHAFRVRARQPRVYGGSCGRYEFTKPGSTEAKRGDWWTRTPLRVRPSTRPRRAARDGAGARSERRRRRQTFVEAQCWEDLRPVRSPLYTVGRAVGGRVGKGGGGGAECRGCHRWRGRRCRRAGGLPPHQGREDGEPVEERQVPREDQDPLRPAPAPPVPRERVRAGGWAREARGGGQV